MVTFTVDEDWGSGGYPERYIYDKGELSNKYDSNKYTTIVIGSFVPIHSGDVLKFTISRRTDWMGLEIGNEEYENGMWYKFRRG